MIGDCNSRLDELNNVEQHCNTGKTWHKPYSFAARNGNRAWVVLRLRAGKMKTGAGRINAQKAVKPTKPHAHFLILT